jgi:hypothetical protein
MARRRVTLVVKSLKEISVSDQVIELGFDSCDDATNDR